MNYSITFDNSTLVPSFCVFLLLYLIKFPSSLIQNKSMDANDPNIPHDRISPGPGTCLAALDYPLVPATPAPWVLSPTYWTTSHSHPDSCIKAIILVLIVIFTNCVCRLASMQPKRQKRIPLQYASSHLHLQTMLQVKKKSVTDKTNDTITAINTPPFHKRNFNTGKQHRFQTSTSDSDIRKQNHLDILAHRTATVQCQL